jgi:hypothetical protein
MTRALLQAHDIRGTVMECCSGDGSIANELQKVGLDVRTNDIDPTRPADYHVDAATLTHECDWTITNPPYQMPLCLDIVRQQIRQSRSGVAMLLRLSFLEPTKARGPFWQDHPLTRLLVLPRYSFTGDGKSDSVTTAWMIWDRSKEDYDDWVHNDPILLQPIRSLGEAKQA